MAEGLQINCDFCSERIIQPGALLFTPKPNQPKLRKKEHICAQCSAQISSIIDLTKGSRGTAGIYYSPPINSSWDVIWRALTKKELLSLQEGLKK